MEKAHKDTLAEVAVISGKADEALSLAKNAMEMIKGQAQKLLTDWEMVILILAVVAAAVCFSVFVAFIGR